MSHRLGKVSTLCLCLILGSLTSQLDAQLVQRDGNIVINEISAASSDRILNWPAGQLPTLGTGTPWTSAEFDDSSWEVSGSPSARSLYCRKTFSVSAEEAARTEALSLYVSYKGGFAAYLNGREVARKNLGGPGGYTYHDELAYNIEFPSGEQTFSLPAAASILQPGANVLAIQVHAGSGQVSPSDISSTLRITGLPVVVLVDTSDSWKYFRGVGEPSGGLNDEDGEMPDWIELRNLDDAIITLDGWSLTDDPNEPDKWIFPKVFIGPGGHVVVFASGKNRTGVFPTLSDSILPSQLWPFWRGRRVSLLR
jgi:hypothetical protein